MPKKSDRLERWQSFPALCECEFGMKIDAFASKLILYKLASFVSIPEIKCAPLSNPLKSIDTCSLRHSIRVSTLARSMEVL